ncbi:unknown [Blautia sp. CAG:37]|nr:unknown [Blautia sp. CAG:37]
MILLAVAVQTEDKEFSLRTDPPLLRAEIETAHFQILPENLVQFRLAGRNRKLLFDTQHIFFLHCKLNHAVFLPFYRDVALPADFHRHGKVAQFLDPRVQRDDRAHAQLPRVDEMQVQIFHFPGDADLVAPCQTIEMDRLVDRKLAGELADPAPFAVGDVQQMKGEAAEYTRFSFRNLHIPDRHLAFFLNHPPHIGPCVRHIVVLIKRNL